MPVRLLVAALILGFLAASARADEFDRLEGDALRGVPSGPNAAAHDKLTVGEIAALPNVLPGVRSAPLVVRTDQGNLARLLAAPALRKPSAAGGEPIPVLVLERFETFEAPKMAQRLARGREIVLFDGFRLDLDSGGIVPDGLGGDLQFVAGGEGGPRLVALGGARIYTLSRSPLPPDPGGGRPSSGRAVAPGDFAGRYRLFSNGQWSGSLELQVRSREDVVGTFRSDGTGATAKVTGQVAPDEPNRLLFEVQFPRSRLAFTGYLWAEGKGAMAGTATLLDRNFGFFAVRDGGRIAPEGEEAGPPPEGEKSVRVEILPGGRFAVDGQEVDAEGLGPALKAKDAPVQLRAPAGMGYADVLKAIEAIRAAGASAIRLGPATAGGSPR